MSFLSSYLKPYRKTLIATLILAGINQVFSLMDPQVLRWLIDNYLTTPDKRTANEYLMGILMGLG